MKLCLLKKESKTDLEISVYNSVNGINKEEWDKLVGQKNIYLSSGYLEAIENALSEEIDFRYLVFHNEQSKPVAIAVVQFLPFYDKDIQDQEHWCLVRSKIKRSIIDDSGIRVMTCGSPFSCGENGFLYSEEITEKDAYRNLSAGLIKLQKMEKSNLNAQVILLKEFWPDSATAGNIIKSEGYRDFMIDVNMVMKINKGWNNFEDYLLSMVTKFRTKAKGAFKKSAAITSVNLNLEEIIQHKETIEQLYQSVVDKAAFQFGSLNGEAFVQLKKKLADRFIFQGYFLKDELVGFSTAFLCNNIVDANYVGINYELNQEHAIYQRILYDYVALAIENKSTELRLGRTAEEIKSTIGASPVNMKLFLRHQNHIKNSLLFPVFGSIAPSTFEIRNPFKVEFQNA